jgi:hypothetical protein
MIGKHLVEVFAAWLVAWWWCLGIVLGAFVNAWIHRLSGGAWGTAVHPVALTLGARLPWLLVLAIPLVVGVPVLYPWAGSGHAAIAQLPRPGFAEVWLDTPFFLLRLACYAAVWWWLTRPAAPRSGGRAAAALVSHVVVTSLAAVDLLMSLMPRWYSTGFGLVVLANQALGGAAWIVLCMPPGAGAPPPGSAAGTPPLSRDLGNLLLMWVMTWGYLAFMQFLIIWAENLPREIAWYVPRLQTGWQPVVVALVVLQLAVPLLLLLWRSVKDRPARLAGVAALLLGSQLLNTAWLVIPSVAPHSVLGWWVVPALALAFGLALFGGLPEQLRRGDFAQADAEVRHARP